MTKAKRNLLTVGILIAAVATYAVGALHFRPTDEGQGQAQGLPTLTIHGYITRHDTYTDPSTRLTVVKIQVNGNSNWYKRLLRGTDADINPFLGLDKELREVEIVYRSIDANNDEMLAIKCPAPDRPAPKRTNALR